MKNILLILLGGFLLGLGIDLHIWSIGILGLVLMIIMIFVSIVQFVESVLDESK